VAKVFLPLIFLNKISFLGRKRDATKELEINSIDIYLSIDLIEFYLVISLPVFK